jgi:uncharacterized protein with von Willebrand factor type A (vWA) domain
MTDLTKDLQTSVVVHDDFDHHAFRESLSLFPKLRNVLETAARSLPTAAKLIEDIFYSLYKPTVNLEEPSELPPSASINRSIIEQMKSTTQWDQVRGAGTVGDLFYSAVAAATIARGVLSAVDQATRKRLRELHEAERAANILYQDAESYDEAANAKPDRSSEFALQAQEARQQAQEEEERVEQVAEELDEQNEQIEDATRQAAREACSSAEDEVEEMEAAIKSYSNGYGDTGPGTGTAPLAMTLKEKISLAQKVGQTNILQQVAELCGRMTRIAMEVQKSKIKHPPTHLVGVEVGDNLTRVLPAELANLSTPQLHPAFYAKYADKQLMQRRMVGYQKQGRGPIIVILDSSGSMRSGLGKTSKEAWSKAVALALLAIARKQKRDFAIIHFSDSYSYTRGDKDQKQIKSFVFPKGEATSTELVATTEFYFGGGTEFEPWMNEALKQVEDSRFTRADVICVSDGEVHIGAELEASWNRRRKAKGMRCWSVYLNDNPRWSETLGRISDGLVTIDNMTAESQALQMMFSI